MIAADWVQVTTLVDNHVNALLPTSEDVQRATAEALGLNDPGNPLIAEFGWSTLVKVGKGGRTHTILYDAGVGRHALVHNARSLRVDLKGVEAVVLSHGHPDHTGSVQEALVEIGRDGLPVIMHPWAVLERMTVRPDGTKNVFPRFLDEAALRARGASLQMARGPTPLAAGTALVTGEIPRVTAFEKGLPPNTQYLRQDGEFKHEPLVLDDQALVVNLQGRGLVVLTGCGHAGVVNTMNYARQVSGVDQIHAIVGGFHLEGAYFDPIIDPTVEAIRVASPRFVVPSHCTGMRASFKLHNAMPSSYVENSVGTTFRF